ncbi:MAG: hypothetical protein BGO14_04385 [Chlamydiales bacterium 38-26]|nr:hypothetical protein [Chlamydiales bacterium]OJV07732.1 MAG: hypothetical protein BGO14_04385 [Chlamydiales bacterium 38-26]
MKITNYFKVSFPEKDYIQQFNQLKNKEHKVGILIITALSGLFTLFLASPAVFRLLVGRFKKIEEKESPESPIPKVNKLAPSLIATSPIVPSSIPSKKSAENENPKPFDPQSEELASLSESPPSSSSAEKIEEKDSARREYIPELKKNRGEGVSERTYYSLVILRNKIKEIMPDHALHCTQDDGNCFWDAFAQSLSSVLSKKITISDLRKAVHQYMQEADATKEDELRKKYAGPETFEEWKEQLLHDGSNGELPSWGSVELEGEILGEIYHVNIWKVEVGPYSDEVDFTDVDNFWYGDDQILISPDFNHTVRIALYPGHFLAILPKPPEEYLPNFVV